MRWYCNLFIFCLKEGLSGFFGRAIFVTYLVYQGFIISFPSHCTITTNPDPLHNFLRNAEYTLIFYYLLVIEHILPNSELFIYFFTFPF